jgi:hypothetical protein
MLPQSENLYQDAFDSDWESNSNEAKQLIYMIIMRAQRPVAVQAGIFGDLCLPTFGSVSRYRFNKDRPVMTQ